MWSLWTRNWFSSGWGIYKFCFVNFQELEMHARAHGIPTTPLTSDTTTALLSSILTVKPSGEGVKIKQEPVDSGCLSNSCGHENQEAMEDYSLPSSCNPSPRSNSMDDDMTDWAGKYSLCNKWTCLSEMQRAEGQHACVLLYDLFLKALRSSESCRDGSLARRYNIMQPCRCPR